MGGAGDAVDDGQGDDHPDVEDTEEGTEEEQDILQCIQSVAGSKDVPAVHAVGEDADRMGGTMNSGAMAANVVAPTQADELV